MNQPQLNKTDARTTQRGGGHSWMMIACCIPMLIIAVALVATGVVGVGFLAFAVGCTVMMAMMMRMMMRDDDSVDRPRDDRVIEDQ